MEQLDGLRPFVEIAHRLVIPVPYQDRDDVEQQMSEEPLSAILEVASRTLGLY